MKRAIYYILAFALCSCAVQRATTSDEFAKDVQKDLPFKVTELKAVSNRANRRFFGENSTAAAQGKYYTTLRGFIIAQLRKDK